MSEISILAIDLAKNSFQVCGVRSDGVVVFNRAALRGRLSQLLSDQSPCVVAMEACATSHHWGRVAMSHGHEVRMICQSASNIEQVTAFNIDQFGR